MMWYIINCDTNKPVNEYATRGEAMKDLRYFYVLAHATLPKKSTQFAVSNKLPKPKKEEWEDGYEESVSERD